MNEFRLNSDRVRLAADIWLHRHGPWWLLLAVLVLVLLALALLVIPGRQAELARQQAMLGDLQARASEPLPVAAATSTSVDNYHRFRATLADEEQVLRTLQERNAFPWLQQTGCHRGVPAYRVVHLTRSGQRAASMAWTDKSKKD